jgi:hypothetical protein
LASGAKDDRSAFSGGVDVPVRCIQGKARRGSCRITTLAQPHAGSSSENVSGTFDKCGLKSPGVTGISAGSQSVAQTASGGSESTVPTDSSYGTELWTRMTLPRATLMPSRQSQSGGGILAERQSGKVSASSEHHSISTIGCP